MTREMEILSDIADQNDVHGNYKEKPARRKGLPLFYKGKSGKIKRMFAGLRASKSRKEKGR